MRAVLVWLDRAVSPGPQITDFRLADRTRGAGRTPTDPRYTDPMTKTRVPPPKAIRDAVMDEFNHKCAICGKERPQVHHIDEDPSNNDPLNLIPLCPNCHLIDQHNPTGTVDPAKVRIFREYKDPSILTPQFHPLFVRLKFLDHISDTQKREELQVQAQELVDFVAELEMGAFYSKQINELIKPKKYMHAIAGRRGDATYQFAENIQRDHAAMLREAAEYREDLRKARGQVVKLIVELLRFQRWGHRSAPRTVV